MKPSPRKESVIYVVEPFGGSVRKHSPSLPLVYADDAAVTRGDGIFESLLVRGGKAANLTRHAQRFRDSARALDLPEPPTNKWEEATRLAIADYYGTDTNLPDAKCTWTYTRGRAATGVPSAWVTVQPLGDVPLHQRSTGVTVLTTPRLWHVAGELPAKTLNYAATMAMLRIAKDKGYDDLILTDPDTGEILEGATSTVVAVRGKKLRTAAGRGILPGTTQAALFDYAQEHGYRCKAKPLTVEYLEKSDSVWLVSSVRVAVRVTKLNEKTLKAPDNEKEIRGLIDAALGA
ncbi:aminodeoxychorismate lyase [Corynebacterium macginleyi]|uniref:Aminodeoxychorismate lyase n=1 Tax=Corynebacterium macginleyi TaxID=38290 RepID=A0A3M0GT02_9CORY|nr:aminodeoxychorismate lyase [Corynebacterium macginleyi]MBK4139826.1 aminodeoxychorismate lyase [Corynebacterium macginleyi]MBK4149795.1 aminodeoxychorismate lyase [Corynebacterium macginleyi]MBK4156416.1 aminodeoxychorismate lyase [Corynebacterium macginleyi]MBK4162197.1 aminodeoxychorismate lyase [Corynebacterium macginleyi]MBK4162481.1 aminodeoxychorismate lyase [Corynebacterium macginleyi]